MNRRFPGTLAGLALVALTSAAPHAPGKQAAVPFIHDDYSKALTEGRARKIPIFVDTWAPW